LANILSNETVAASGLETTELPLISGLLQDQYLMKQILTAGGPRGNRYVKALQIYEDIQSTYPRAKDGVFLKVAIAIALELAAPDFVGDYDLIDPKRRYGFYEESYIDGELIDQFAEFTVWELRHVVNARAKASAEVEGEVEDKDKDGELQLLWLRKMLNNFRPDYVITEDDRRRFVGIQSDADIIPQKSVQYDKNEPYSWHQQVMAKGGQCGAKARFVRNVLRSFGVPTWGFQVHGHDGVGYWTPSGWQSNLSVRWEFGFLKAEVVSEYMAAPLFLLETQSRAIPDDYLKALRLEWVADVLGEEDVDLMYAGRGGLWNALALNWKRIIRHTPTTAGDSRNTQETVPLWKRKPTPSDKEITTHADGTITIPAIAVQATLSYYGSPMMLIPDKDGSFLLHDKRRTESKPFSYVVDVPRAGSYALSADVATVLENHSFMLTVNDGEEQTRVELPYTVGMWETSKPVTVSLVQGQNRLTFTRGEPRPGAKEILRFASYCAKASDPGCGGVTIRSFFLTPL